MNYLERGQPSCIKSPKAETILKPRVNYSKSSLKNPLDIVYETPKPDEKKLAKLEDRFPVIENLMAILLQNQQTQTNLLMQLAKSQGLTP